MRLLAAEIFLHRPISRPAEQRGALLPVHSVTVVNAFGHAWRRAAAEQTKRILLLQAAGWVAEIRDALVKIVGLPAEGAAVDAPGGEADEPRGLDELLEDPTPGALCARLRREPAERAALEARLAGLLARKGVEHHQHKYAAAVFEECALAHSRWAPHLLACAARYLPTPDEPETETCERARKALRAAGIG